MRRLPTYLAALLFCVLSGSTASAATDGPGRTPRLLVGLHAGASRTTIDFDRRSSIYSTTARSGGSAGVTLLLPRNRHSSLRTGLTIRTAGADYRTIPVIYPPKDVTPPRPQIEHSIRLVQAVLPILIRVSPVSHLRGPCFDLGVEVSRLLSVNESGLYPWELGSVIGLGTGGRVRDQRVFAEVSYHHGISPIWRSNFGGGPNGTSRALRFSVGVWP